MSEFVYDDGGRTEAGYKGQAGDCVVRAAAIAAGVSYRSAYDLVNDLALSERQSKRRRGRSSARNGVHKVTTRRLMEQLGGVWTPTMQIGSGCQVHVRSDELPAGRLVLQLSRHVAAFIDGVLHDTYDCSREGTRCVYGYWKFPDA